MAQCCPEHGLQWNLEGLDHLWECQWVDTRGTVCVMGIEIVFEWRGGSGGCIVLFELLDGHITQNFVDVGRKKDGSRRPSGGRSASRRCSGSFLRVMVETKGGLLRLVVWTWKNSSADMSMPP